MRIITESQRCVCVCVWGGYSDIGVGLADFLALEFRYLLKKTLVLSEVRKTNIIWVMTIFLDIFLGGGGGGGGGEGVTTKLNYFGG